MLKRFITTIIRLLGTARIRLRIRTLVIAIGVVCAYWVVMSWLNPKYLPLLHSVAIDADGNRVVLISGFDDVKTLILTDSEPIIELRERLKNRTSELTLNRSACGISRKGDILTFPVTLVDFAGQGPPAGTPVDDVHGGRVGFTDETIQKIVVWSAKHLEVYPPTYRNMEWRMPLEDDRQIAAVSWSGDPVHFFVLTRSRDKDPDYSSHPKITSATVCQVEEWAIGSTEPDGIWKLPTIIYNYATAVVSPDGGSVVTGFQTVDSDLLILQKTKPNEVTRFSGLDVRCDYSSDKSIAFLDNTTAVITDLAGNIVVVNTNDATVSRIERKGKPCDQLAVAANGTLLALGRQMSPILELWRNDENGLHPWITIDVGTGKIVKNLKPYARYIGAGNSG